MSLVYPDPIQGPNSPLAKSFAYQPTPHYPQLVFNEVNLRDYFAAAIMQGLMASQYQVEDPYPIYAYKIADAMLKAREVKP
jgi:hypothetical protein